MTEYFNTKIIPMIPVKFKNLWMKIESDSRIEMISIHEMNRKGNKKTAPFLKRFLMIIVEG